MTLPKLPDFNSNWTEDTTRAWFTAWAHAYTSPPRYVAVSPSPTQRGRLLRDGWMNAYYGPTQYHQGAVYDTHEAAAAKLAQSGRTDARTVRVLIYEDTEAV